MGSIDRIHWSVLNQWFLWIDCILSFVSMALIHHRAASFKRSFWWGGYVVLLWHTMVPAWIKYYFLHFDPFWLQTSGPHQSPQNFLNVGAQWDETIFAKTREKGFIMIMTKKKIRKSTVTGGNHRGLLLLTSAKTSLYYLYIYNQNIIILRY